MFYCFYITRGEFNGFIYRVGFFSVSSSGIHSTQKRYSGLLSVLQR